MSSASRGLAPRVCLESLLVKMGRTGPLAEPRHGPQAGKSGDPRSQNADIEDLLSGCRACLRCVAWFSYWFDDLGFISEGNTYRRCAASSLPLWGNTGVASSDIKRNF